MHVGVRGLDRAVAVCDALRGYLPHLLALSANSPFSEGVWTELHSARTQTFVRMFPRCGIPDVFGGWAEHRRFYELLVATGLHRGVHAGLVVGAAAPPVRHRRGAHRDAQTEPWQNLAVSALSVGLIAYLAGLYDQEVALPVQPTRYVEENLWRAIRFGMDGKLVDFEREREEPAADALRRLVELASPRAAELGLKPYFDDVERMLREGNGAQRQAAAHREGRPIEDVFAAVVTQTAEAVEASSALEAGKVEP